VSATSNLPVLDLPEQVARIDRTLAETQKLFAETGKLTAEAAKFRRDPWFILAGAMVGAAATQLPALLRGLGLIA